MAGRMRRSRRGLAGRESLLPCRTCAIMVLPMAPRENWRRLAYCGPIWMPSSTICGRESRCPDLPHGGEHGRLARGGMCPHRAETPRRFGFARAGVPGASLPVPRASQLGTDAVHPQDSDQHADTWNPARASRASTARLADPWAVNEVYPGYLMKLGMLGVGWPLAASELELPLYIGVPARIGLLIIVSPAGYSPVRPPHRNRRPGRNGPMPITPSFGTPSHRAVWWKRSPAGVCKSTALHDTTARQRPFCLPKPTLPAAVAREHCEHQRAHPRFAWQGKCGNYVGDCEARGWQSASQRGAG